MAFSRSESRSRLTPAGLGTAVLAVGCGAAVAGVLLVAIGMQGPAISVEPAVGSVALGVAGADRLFALAYVGLGLERLYLTAMPLAVGLAGVAAALTGRWWSLPVGVALGATAAGTLTVLGGCPCGGGTTAFLAERAVRRAVHGAVLFAGA